MLSIEILQFTAFENAYSRFITKAQDSIEEEDLNDTGEINDLRIEINNDYSPN